MKVIKSYLNGVKATLRSFKMIFTLYILTLIFALVFTLSFRSILSSAAGSSMLIYPLFKEFDFTIFTEFLTQHKDLSNFVTKQFLWYGIFYFVFTIFATGGILTIIHKQKNNFSIGEFFKGCGEYFFRFIKLGLIVLILHILIAAVIYFGVSVIIDKYVDIVESESTLVYIAGIGILLHLIIAGILFIITDYTKIVLVRNDSRKVFRSFWNTLKFVFKHFFGVVFLYLFLFMTPLFITIIYFLIESKIGMISPITILIMFIIQQIYIWTRLFIRIWFLVSQYNYHDYFFIPDINENEPVLIAEQNNIKLSDLDKPEVI